MKIKSIIPIEKRKNCRCHFCGETRSVKYTTEIIDPVVDSKPTEVCVCNKCILTHNEPTELSYVDLLQKLKADVTSDAIPKDDKVEIINTICKLEELLWPYSA